MYHESLIVEVGMAHKVDMAHEVKSPENQPQFSQIMTGQYWLKLSHWPEMLSKVAMEF